MEAQGPHAAPHVLGGLVGNRWDECDEALALAIDSIAWPESVTKKVERPFGILLRTICVFAVDDLRLLRVQLQLTFRKPLFQRLT